MSKVWFVTGASRGIGMELVQHLLDKGFRVVATARRSEAITQALSKYMEKNNNAKDAILTLNLDVTNKSQIEEAVKSAVQHFGQIDFLVNNAGYGQMGYFETITEEEARAQFDVNVFGTMNLTRAVLPIMRRQRSGVIIIVSSIAGLVGSCCGSMYCASKFALEGWSDGLGLEVAPFNIHIHLTEPGPFRTEFFNATSVKFGDPARIVALEGDEEATQRYRESALEVQQQYLNRIPDGCPKKLVSAMVQLTTSDKIPQRFIAGEFAIKRYRAKEAALDKEIKSWEELSLNTAIDK